MTSAHAAIRKTAGDVNAHTHVYSGLVPLGMPQPWPSPAVFTDILAQVWWRLDRALDERTLRAAARYYVAHALMLGTTVLVDHHESPQFIEGSLDVIADACEELGMQALLCYGATERNGGRDEARRGLAECRRFIASNHRPLVRGAVGLHASFTVSDDTMREAGDLARESKTVLHVHVAEDMADVADALKRGYSGPLERLAALQSLPRGSVLAHGVCLDTYQVQAAESIGCWLVQNARSNRQNRVGYPWALSASSRVALGTDGFESDMAVERRAVEVDAARHGEDVAIAIERADRGAALAAELWNGSTQVCGICERDGDRVMRVVRGDRVLVNDGRLQTGDMKEIEAEAREAAALLWTRLGQ